jgi:hypothetical protein
LPSDIRDAETLDGLRAGFRRIWQFLTVMPAECVENAAEKYPDSRFVIFPMPVSPDPDELTTSLPVPAKRYAEGLTT